MTDRRAARRAETQAEIVAAAWELAREHGLAGLALRDLGARVGMKAQSLYSYFDSKHAIYDAMFLEGYLTAEEVMAPYLDDVDPGDDPLGRLIAASRAFFAFCTEDPVRYQLLFQRTIPGFEPSPESWAVAVRYFERFVASLAPLGITDPADIDLWTAVFTGLSDQQLSNDPGGDRWERLVDRAVRMVVAEVAPHLLVDAPARGRTTTRTRKGARR